MLHYPVTFATNVSKPPPALRGPEALPPLAAAPTEKRYVVIKRNPIADRSLR